jgi:hypothetical protein
MWIREELLDNWTDEQTRNYQILERNRFLKVFSDTLTVIFGEIKETKFTKLNSLIIIEKN